MDRVASGALINDRGLIGLFAHVLAMTPLCEVHQCFCSGWTTANFYKSGELVYSLAAIHGNQIRAYSQQGGGDFTVDDARWNVVHDLIEKAQKSAPLTMPIKPPMHISITEDAKPANQALLPTATSVMPPAGQDARQP